MENWNQYLEFALKAAAIAVPILLTIIKIVSKLERTTDNLALSIQHLTTSVVKLDTVLSHTQRDVATIKERLAVVETLASLLGAKNHAN